MKTFIEKSDKNAAVFILTTYVVCLKSIANFEFPRNTYTRFSIFLMVLCWYSYPSLMPTSSAILNVNFWQLFCLDVFWLVFDFCLFQKMDQRTCIKFCVKNKIKCMDAFRMLTVAYGEATFNQSNVCRWYKMFSEGLEDVNDEERAGRPSTSTTNKTLMK